MSHVTARGDFVQTVYVDMIRVCTYVITVFGLKGFGSYFGYDDFDSAINCTKGTRRAFPFDDDPVEPP